MLKTWYVVHFLVPKRHTCAPQVSWFFGLSGIRYLASQVGSHLPAACLRTHACCLAGWGGSRRGGVWFLVLHMHRDAIPVSAWLPVCIIMYTRGAPGSTVGLNLGVSWVGWIPEGPHPTSLPCPHLLLVSFAASVASPACTGLPGGVHFFTALCPTFLPSSHVLFLCHPWLFLCFPCLQDTCLGRAGLAS